jgi:hypothetical protein
MERIVAGLWPDIVCHVPAEVSRNFTVIRIYPLNACQSRDPQDQSADANCDPRFKPSHPVCDREASAWAQCQAALFATRPTMKLIQRQTSNKKLAPNAANRCMTRL